MSDPRVTTQGWKLRELEGRVSRLEEQQHGCAFSARGGWLLLLIAALIDVVAFGGVWLRWLLAPWFGGA